MEIEIYCDGGARGNPGPAAVGAVLREKRKDLPAIRFAKAKQTGKREKILDKTSKYLGLNLTNNQAEYHAVIEGLRAAKEYKPDKVTVFMDSQLVVEQLNLRYKLKNAGLKKLFDQVISLKLSFPVVEFKYIPREENKEADRLVNKALNATL